MLARATCARAAAGRSSGSGRAPLGRRSKTRVDAMGAVFSRGRASTENRAHRDASGRVATASVARDDLVSATDVESTGASGPAGPAIRTSKDLASWLAARDGAATLVRCEGALTPDVASSAEALGVDVESIVKSLVFAVDGAFVVVVTNGETKVDVKKLAARMGVANRRVRLATREETIDACGFVPGTVPPFGHKEKLRTFVDASVPTEVGAGAVFGGGGDADAEVRVESVDELLRLTDGELLDVKKRERGEALPEVVPAYDEREARREARGENERYPRRVARRQGAVHRRTANRARVRGGCSRAARRAVPGLRDAASARGTYRGGAGRLRRSAARRRAEVPRRRRERRRRGGGARLRARAGGGRVSRFVSGGG